MANGLLLSLGYLVSQKWHVTSLEYQFTPATCHLSVKEIP